MLPTEIFEIDISIGGLPLGTINTLIFDDPLVKTSFISAVVSSNLKRSGLTIYLDLDTTFTVHLQQGFINITKPEELVIFTPDGRELDDLMAQIFSLNLSERDLIIFDSATAFHHIHGNTSSFISLNRKMGLYLAFLDGLAQRYGVTTLILSMLRYKKNKIGGPNSWFTSPSGGRVLEKKSSMILSLTTEYPGIKAKVLKHPRREIEKWTSYLKFPFVHNK